MIKYNYNDILGLEKYYRISLINKISGLKSANLIGTKDIQGIPNLAIFNSVVHIGANPPHLGFIMRPLEVDRHTYSNIKEMGYFTVNQVCEEIHKEAHHTSAKFAKGESEFDTCKLSEMYIDDFPIPFVKESKIKIGLSFQEEHLIKANNTILIIGKIENITLPDGAISEDGDIDLAALNTVAIAGLDTYYNCTRIARYEYARVNNEIRKIE